MIITAHNHQITVSEKTANPPGVDSYRYLELENVGDIQVYQLQNAIRKHFPQYFNSVELQRFEIDGFVISRLIQA